MAGIILSLILLIWLAWRNVSVIVLAPLCATLAVLLDGELPVLAAYTQIFMASVGQFIVRFFPLFLLGAILGRLMEDSGSAARIAVLITRWLGTRRSVLAVVLSCAVLTYGGVSLFVVVFAVHPLCRSLFREADIPRRLIPAAIALGAFTFTMTALPGSVQIQNLIPMPFFRTDAYAAPWLGCLGGGLMFAMGMAWLNHRVKTLQQAGEGFGSDGRDEHSADSVRRLPSAFSAMAPIVCVIILNYAFSRHLIPGWETSYLAEPRFGGTELSRVAGLWSAILSLLFTVVLTIALHFRSAAQLQKSVAAGAGSALLPIFNTASEFGYGSTIAALSGFAVVRQFVTGLAPDNPLISESIAVNTLAAITGSASG